VDEKVETSWFSILRVIDVSTIGFVKDSEGRIVLGSSDEYSFRISHGLGVFVFALPVLGYVALRAIIVNDLQWWINASFSLFPLFVVSALCVDRRWSIDVEEMTIIIQFRIFGRFIFWTRQSELETYLAVKAQTAYSDRGKTYSNIRDLFLAGPYKRWPLLRCKSELSWNDSLARLNRELSIFLEEKKSEMSINRCSVHFFPNGLIQTVESIGKVVFFAPFLLIPIDMASRDIEFSKTLLVGLGLGGFSLWAISNQVLLGRVVLGSKSESSRDDTKQ